MGKPNFVARVLKAVLEGERVVAVDPFTVAVVFVEKFVVVLVLDKLVVGVRVAGNVILKILNIFARSIPPILLAPECVFVWLRLTRKLFLGEDHGLHPCLVKTVGLRQIQNFKLDGCRPLSLDNHFEVKPLGVALGVEIIFEPQVVFCIVHFAGLPQVAALKTTVKEQHVVQVWHCARVLQSFERAAVLPIILLNALVLLSFNFTLEVTVPSFRRIQCAKSLHLLLREKYVWVHAPSWVLLVVFGYALVSHHLRVGIIDQRSSQLHLFCFFRLLLKTKIRLGLSVYPVTKWFQGFFERSPLASHTAEGGASEFAALGRPITHAVL